MTDRENLPSKSSSRGVVASTEHSGSIVARGLAAVLRGSKEHCLLPPKEDPGRIFLRSFRFHMGMSYLKRYEDGDCSVQEDAEQACEYLTGAADLDHAEAQYRLYEFLGRFGEVEEEDREEGIEWLESSAQLGFGPALYDWAEGILDAPEESEQKKDYMLKAHAWYRARAVEGDAQSQYEFANKFSSRDREPWTFSIKEALRWYKASAEQGYVPACMWLGKFYLQIPQTEWSTPESRDEFTHEGVFWLARAADLGDARACGELGRFYVLGHHHGFYSALSGRLPPLRRITPDKKLAESWYERGIELQKHGYFAEELGDIYLKGEHLNHDPQLAEKWLLHAANQGSRRAGVMLGVEYASGARMRQDTSAALHWLGLAADRGGSDCLPLANVYLDGKIVPKDLDGALELLTRAGEEVFVRQRAMKLVAKKCFDGRLNANEELVARSWLARMAVMTLESVSFRSDRNANSNDSAARGLASHKAELYELGLGVAKDQESAISWYRQAAKLGSYPAKVRLKELGVEWEAD